MVLVVFCLVPEFLNASFRQYEFMLKGLEQVDLDLRKLNIPFHLITGSPEREIPRFIERCHAGALVTDFDPLRIKRRWKNEIDSKIRVPFFEIDAHNIVPCLQASSKQEYSAATMRGKIHRLLSEYLTEIAPTKKQTKKSPDSGEIDWNKIRKIPSVDASVCRVHWIAPGERNAYKSLNDFIETRFERYSRERNNATKNAQSNLSPYLHFGHISAQRIALEIKKRCPSSPSTVPFLEELIVRKELSDNYCFYNGQYDSFEGFPAWSQKTLNAHRDIKREYLYSLEEFETASTHDDLWNAAQLEIVKTGKMHGYMRMYWAKKILEWTQSPEDALDVAIYLNDKYALDGRDPNGYTGIAWSIGGVHDRAWPERPVFGKIRYMSYNGCKSKFDIKRYITAINELER